jgi:hypothetical protein
MKRWIHPELVQYIRAFVWNHHKLKREDNKPKVFWLHYIVEECGLAMATVNPKFRPPIFGTIPVNQKGEIKERDIYVAFEALQPYHKWCFKALNEKTRRRYNG